MNNNYEDKPASQQIADDYMQYRREQIRIEKEWREELLAHVLFAVVVIATVITACEIF